MTCPSSGTHTKKHATIRFDPVKCFYSQHQTSFKGYLYYKTTFCHKVASDV